MKLTFLGANRQVTGSRYLLEAAGRRIMIDCGLFQERAYVGRNYEACPVQPAGVDALLLTHAHLDHCGLIPRLVREGFRGPIHATGATGDLAAIVLADSARLLQEDVAYKARRHQREGRTAAHPYAAPYGPADVDPALALLRPVRYGQPVALADGLHATWRDAGHILGSAMIDIAVRENGADRRLVFSGDLGLRDTPIIRDPTLLEAADFVVMESTYGDRDHDRSTPIEDQLAELVSDTVRRGGNVVVPTFAIERAQELLFHLSRLRRAGRIPNLMVFLDSPMAVDATDVFLRHGECLDEQTIQMLRSQESPFRFPGLVFSKTTQQSKAINQLRGSCVILAGSGMCTGGRIKHHLAQHLGRPESTILFVGYQAHGTLGREIVDGSPQVRVFGQVLPVRARIAQLHGLSAHADRSTLLRWLGHFRPSPRQVFLTHGEADAAESLAAAIRERLSISVIVPEYKQAVELG